MQCVCRLFMWLKWYLCPFSGYVMFSLSEISLWKMSSISINRYVLIVHPDYFYTIFSVRNSRIIVAFVWPLYSPLLCALPLLRAWDIYMFDVKQCLCTPLNTADTGFRTLVLFNSYHHHFSNFIVMLSRHY